MAAPRTSSFKILRNLQKASSSVPAKRSLHITGVNSSPRPVEFSQKHSYAPLSIQTLRSECSKRSLTQSGTEHELVERLAVHDDLQARAFSIAMKRIARDQARKPSRYALVQARMVLQPASKRFTFANTTAHRPAQETPSRHFNTSRSLKAPGDSSTIDFTYLPDIDSSSEPTRAEIRVPILPHIESDDAQAILDHHKLDVEAAGADDAAHSAVMKPQIVTVTETLADGAHVDLDLNGHASAMSEVQDNHGTEMTVDALTELAGTVGRSARKLVGRVPEQTAVKRVWSGFLDDLFGEKRRLT